MIMYALNYLYAYTHIYMHLYAYCTHCTTTQKTLLKNFEHNMCVPVFGCLGMLSVYVCLYMLYLKNLTCPLSSSGLLVSLSQSKETVCFIHWAPLAGESGWKWTLPGGEASPRPATNQEELWKAYLHRRGREVKHTKLRTFMKSLIWIIQSLILLYWL